MKIWKKIMIVALSVLAISMGILASVVLSLYIDDKRKHHYSSHDDMVWLSENIQEVYHKKSYRLKDARTGKFTTPKLDCIYHSNDPADTLLVFRDKNAKRGYLSINTGRIVIPAQYEHAWNFSEGLAAVYHDGYVSFINMAGEPAFPQHFPCNYTSGRAFAFHDGTCTMCAPDGNWGLIDTNGNWILEPQYREIDKPYHGYRRISDGSLYGLLNSHGEEVLPLQYDNIKRANDGNGFLLQKEGICQQVDFSMQVTNPFVHDGIHMLSYIDDYPANLSDDYSIIMSLEPQFFRYDVGYGSGVIDSYGNVIIPAKYEMVRLVNDHLFEVQVTCYGERLLFDTNGNIVNSL